ncbi:LT4R1 protein, partial [Polypterus senegalus]
MAPLLVPDIFGHPNQDGNHKASQLGKLPPVTPSFCYGIPARPLPEDSMALMATNQSNDTEDSENVVSNNLSTGLGTFILSLVFFIGVPGNLFIIWSILFRTRKRSVTCLLILNLAFADGGLMLLTPFFTVYLALRDWIFGEFMCKCLFYLCCMNMYASIFFITLMSLDRLVAVAWPHQVPSIRRKRIVVKILIVLWLVTFIFAIPAVMFRHVTTTDNSTRRLCSAHHPFRKDEVFQYSFETVFSFIVPFTIILSSYCYILHHLRTSKFQRKLRSENLILAIIGAFGFFWLPYHVVNIIQNNGHHVTEVIPMLANKAKSHVTKFESNSFVNDISSKKPD